MPEDPGVTINTPNGRQVRSRGLRHGSLHRHPILEGLVRQSVVPELVRSRRAGVVPAMPQPSWAMEAAELSRVLPGLELDESARALRALNPGGRRFEAVCHDILLPAAAHLRHVRDHEDADQSGYLLGLWRLRMLLTGLDDDGRVTGERARGGAAALVVEGGSLAPTLEHAVVLRFFRRAGWAVHSCGRAAAEDPRIAASRTRFELAWFSVDDGTDLHWLCRVVAEVRHASRNPTLRVLSGGQELAPSPPPELLGADAMTADATVAASLAQRVLSLH